MATTRWDRLLNGLQPLRVPTTFILTLTLMRRYLHILMNQVEETHWAIRSRLAVLPSGRISRGMIAVRMGTLFRKSLAFSQEVYQAMLARGYRGEVLLLDPPRLRKRDYLWLGTCAVLMAGVAWAAAGGLK